MIKNLLKNLSSLIPPTIIVLMVGFLSWKNYTPGTILAGWDSLHPEFNFPLAFERAIFGVWREEQGVGAIAAHAHMADLPRILFLWFSSIFIKTQFLRYFYILLCLLIGPLGVYFFLKRIFEKKDKGIWVNLAALLGSFYYLLNLATMQHFLLPFEMFNTQFAALPWLFLFVVKVLEEGKKRNYLILFIISLLAAPMAYASTLFYAYLGGILLFIFFNWFLGTDKKTVLKRGILVLALIFASNAFWILPNLYSVKNQSDTISNSKINSLFSPEAFLRNKDYGVVSNILIHKGFLFGWRVYDFPENSFKDLMSPWSQHLSDPFIVNLGLGFSLICLLGATLSLIKREKIGFAIFAVGIFSVFFLINDNFPTSVLYRYLYEHFDIFREGYRMPFTKFSILFLFSMSFFFGYFFYKLFLFLSKRKIFKLLPLIISSSVVFGLCVFMQPAFGGELISSVVKIKIPEEYFDAYKFLNGKEGRIAKLPIQSLYNWEYHDWRYEGSGWFTWFVAGNPQFDRDFDRWSSFNENFYNEVSMALYSKNSEVFNKVLEKYRVSYLLLDESTINPGGSVETLYISEIKEILSKNNTKEIGKFGFLTVYENQKDIKNLVWSDQTFSKINTDAKYVQTDINYSKYGNYVNDSLGNSYPFSNLDLREDVKISVEGNVLVFENSDLHTKITIPTKDKIIENFKNKRGYALGYNCDLLKEGRVDKTWADDSVNYKAEDGGVSCDYFAYQNLSYDQAYVVRLKGENKTGRSLKVYLYNFAEKRMNLEELMSEGNFDEYFVVYPKPNLNSQQGYSLNIETRSFGSIPSENTLTGVEFYPFDLSTLEGVYQGNLVPEVISNNLRVIDTKKIGDSFLITTHGSGIFVLGEGYESGWQAFSLNCESGFVCQVKKVLPWFFEKPLEHLKVNSWENGWKVDSEEGNILITFWPQYLEWGGFAILVLFSCGLIVYKDRKRRK